MRPGRPPGFAAQSRAALAVCASLAAGREPGPVGSPAAAVLRSFLRHHGLSGLAARAIEEERLTLPRELAEKVRRDWEQARGWAAILDLETGRIGRAAIKHSERLSPPILLKGPSVALRYRDPSVRTYVDIDLLVPRAQQPAWGRVLVELGFGDPGRWSSTTSLRYHHHVLYRRQVGSRQIACDLHGLLSVDRRARSFGHAALARGAHESSFPGLLEPSLEGELVLLALHFTHHIRGTRRLIWLRDFIELCDREAVAGARRMAARYGIRWALEQTLFETELLLGRRVWGGAPARARGWGLARVLELDHPHLLYNLGLAREFGPVGGARYLASRIDPRRFVDPGGSFRRGAFRAWAMDLWKKLLSTPWGQGLRGRR